MSYIESRYSGPDAVFCLADIVKPTIGSRNGIKCIVDGDEETYIKDVGLLLQSLDIEHPVGQYVVSVCKSFHTRHGTGTKSLLCMIGLLMKTATSLQSQGVPASIIIKNLRKCIHLCCDHAEDIKIPLHSKLYIQKSKEPASSIIQNTRKCTQLCGDHIEDIKIPLHSKLYIQKTKEPVCARNLKHQCSESQEGSRQSNSLDQKLLKVNSGKMLEHGCSNQESLLTNSNAEKTPYCNPSQLNKYPVKQLKQEVYCLPQGEQKVSVGSCDTIHLKLANHIDENMEEDSDIDWFFESDPLEESTAVKDDSVKIINVKKVNNASIGHVTSLENQSDSDFEDCFDDIPSVVKFNFQEYKKNSDTKITKNSDTDLHRDKDGDLQSVKNDEIMVQKSLSQTNSFVVGKPDYSISGDCYANDMQISCKYRTNTNDDSDLTGGNIYKDDWESCFMQNKERDNSKSKQKINFLKPDSNESCFKKNELGISKSVTDMSLSEVQNLIKDLNISKPAKSVTSSKVLNSSRHFKTVASTLHELNVSKYGTSECQKISHVKETEFDCIKKSDNFGSCENFDKSESRLKEDCVSDSQRGLIVSKVKSLLNFQTSDTEEKNNFPKLICSKNMKSSTKTSIHIDTDSKTKSEIDLTSINSMLDMIHQRQPIKNSQKPSFKESLIRSRHFKDDLNATTEKEVDKTYDGGLEKKTTTLVLDHLPASGCNGQNSLVNKSFGQFIDVQKLDHSGKNDTETVEEPFPEKREITQSLASCTDNLKSLAQSLCHGDSFAMDIVVKALINQWKERMDTNISEVRLDVSQLHFCAVIGPALEHPDIVPGLVISVSSNIMSQIIFNKQLNTLLINGDITPSFHHIGYKKTVESHVIYTTSDVLQSSYKGDNWLSQIELLLKQFSVELLLIKGKASDDVKVMCESLRIIVIETIPYRVLQNISNSADIPMVVYITDIIQDNICTTIRIKYFHDNWMMKNKQFHHIVIECTLVPFQTVMYSHPTRHSCDIMEQEFWRCSSILSSALKSGYVLPGGGITEALCAENLLLEAEKRLANKKHSYTDPYFYVVSEQFSNALNGYHELVIRNSNRDSMALKSTETVEQHCQCAENLHKKDVITEEITPDQSDSLVKGEMCMTCRRKLLPVIDVAQCRDGNIPIFDEYNSKLDSWNVALKTVSTVLQTDSYIITGVTNDMRKTQNYKSSIIL